MEPINKLFRDCEKMYYGTLKLIGNGQVGYTCYQEHPGGSLKDAVPLITAWTDPKDIIDEKVGYCSPAKHTVLYVEPKARIPRDILRNSGYKITLDPDKADCCVIPEVQDYFYGKYYYDLVAYNKETKSFYMFDLRNKWGSSLDMSDCSDYTNKLLEDKVNELYGTPGVPMEVYYHSDTYATLRIYTLKPIQCYYDIIEDLYPNREYVYDCYVEFTPTNDISLETLEVWSHINDKTLLEKCFCGCDWHKYPLTLMTFLEGEFGYDYFRGQVSRSLKMVLDHIGYYVKYDKKQDVNPDDWNMLQTWIMYKLHTKDNGKDFITQDQFSNLDSAYKKFLRLKAAVSPMLINETTNLQNLQYRVKDC